MSPTTRDRLSLLAWLSLLGLALWCLHRLKPAIDPASAWASASAPAPDGGDQAALVIAAGLRFIALGLGWYLLAATVGSVLLHGVHAHRTARRVESVAPVFVRKLVRGAAGLSLAATMTIPLASAGAAPLRAGMARSSCAASTTIRRR